MYTAPSFAVFYFKRETLKVPQKIHLHSSKITFSSQTYQPPLIRHFVPFVLFVFDMLYHIDYSMHYEFAHSLRRKMLIKQQQPKHKSEVFNPRDCRWTHIYTYIYILLSVLIISSWSNSHRIVVIFRVTRSLIQLICFRRCVVCDVCMVCMLLRSMWRRSDTRDLFRYLEYAPRRYSCFRCNNCLYLLAS